MASNVSSFKTCVNMFTDPREVFLFASCLSTIAGRVFNLCGKDCNFADLTKIGGVFASLFGFWDSGAVVQSAYDGARDVKTVMWDHYHKGKEPAEIQKESNENMPRDVNPYQWMAERVVASALKTFASFVLAYELLGSIGAIKKAPSAKLKALGCAAAVAVYAYKVIEDERKIDEEVLALGDESDRYKELHKKYYIDEQYKDLSLIFVKLVGIVAALGSVYGSESLLGKISPWSGDLITLGYTTFGALSLKQQLQSGAEMRDIEAQVKK